jgi:hypothetical protein
MYDQQLYEDEQYEQDEQQENKQNQQNKKVYRQPTIQKQIFSISNIPYPKQVLQQYLILYATPEDHIFTVHNLKCTILKRIEKMSKTGKFDDETINRIVYHVQVDWDKHRFEHDYRDRVICTCHNIIAKATEVFNYKHWKIASEYVGMSDNKIIIISVRIYPPTIEDFHVAG